MRFPRFIRRPEQPPKAVPESLTVTLGEEQARVCQLALSHLMGRAGESDDPFMRDAAAVLIRLTEILDGDEPYFKDFKAALVAAVDQADAELRSQND